MPSELAKVVMAFAMYPYLSLLIGVDYERLGKSTLKEVLRNSCIIIPEVRSVNGPESMRKHWRKGR